MSRTRRSLMAISWMFAVMALGSCSCEGDRVQEQRPSLRSNLAPDSGDADFLVDFGSVLLGETSTRRFRLENSGSAGLSVQVQRPSAPFNADLPASLSSIDVGGSVEISFRYAPKEDGEVAEQIIEVATNEGAGGKTYRLRLLGEGVSPSLDCEPASLDFGAVLLESTASLEAVCTNPLTVPVSVQSPNFRGEHGMYFSASIVGGGDRELAPGEDIQIEVTLRAQSLGSITATLELRDPTLQPITQVPVQARVVTSKVLVEPASCLDFSYVAIGTTSTKSLQLVNVGSDDVEITAIEVPPPHQDDFSIATALPLQLAADGGTATVEVAFHPQSGGSRNLNLAIRTDESQTPAQACVTGFGGGPALACTPQIRDMGAVGIGYPGTAIFHCSNVGAAPEGVPIDPLIIENLQGLGGAFSALVRNPDGSVGERTTGYRVGESFRVEVQYAPQAEGFDEATVVVETNVNDVELKVAGEGREVQPCDFSIAPPSMRFGVVAQKSERTQELEIHNHGSDICLVRDLRLSEDSSPTFRMEELIWAEIQPGETLRVPITFAPTEASPGETGRVLFELSHPTEGSQEVPLSGGSVTPCLLIEPVDADFGATAPGCQELRRDITISNVCGAPLTVDSIELGGSMDADAFDLFRHSVPPITLEAQQFETVTVAFNPTAIGSYAATLEVEVSSNQVLDDNLYVGYLFGEGSLNTTQVDDFTTSGPPMIDILWVIDNSGSMRRYQEVLQDNLPAFMTFANSQRVQFHIGVTTTALFVGGHGCPGGAEGGEDGRLFPIDGSFPRILTPSTQNLEAAWRNNMSVGTCFGPNAESALEAAYRALSPPLINETKDSRYNSPYMDGNAGFLRPHANLSVILVSDAQDFSPRPNQEYVDFFWNVKRGMRDQVRVHAITGPRAADGGSCGAAPGDKMINVVEATEGTWLSLCTPTDDEAWTKALEKMSEGVFSFGKRNHLRGIPGDANGDGKVDEQDIVVTINGRVEPPTRGGSKVWVYDPNGNAIYFEPLYIPKAGAEITATYELACR